MARGNQQPADGKEPRPGSPAGTKRRSPDSDYAPEWRSRPAVSLFPVDAKTGLTFHKDRVCAVLARSD